VVAQFGFKELIRSASTRSFGPTRKLKKALCSFTDLRMTILVAGEIHVKLTHYNNYSEVAFINLKRSGADCFAIAARGESR
jgi:hypothetical protein